MQNEYLKLLTDLIENRSVSADVEAVNRAQGIMRDFLEKRGVYCTEEMIGKNRVLYASTMPGKVQKVLLNAHLDVVPAQNESQYTPVIKDDIMYGRGTDDCLGNAVTAAKVLVDLKDKASVSAIFTADEEIGGKTTLGMIDAGYIPSEIALVIDGGGRNEIAYSEKGALIVGLKAIGHGGHSSIPWCFENAIDKLIDGYMKLRNAWQNPTSGNDWRNSMSAVVMNCGSANNMIPDEAKMILNIRFVNQDDPEKIVQFIKDTTGLEVSYERDITFPVTTEKDAEAIKKLGETFVEMDPEYPIKFIRMCGATDARHIVKTGVPIAIIGSEYGDGCHGNNEFISISGIDHLTEKLKAYALKMSK